MSAAAEIQNLIVKRTDGVFANLAKLESPAVFQTSVERIFSSGYYFVDLDYECFLDLLRDHSTENKPLAETKGAKDSTIRFAADIVEFPPERRALYKAIKIVDGEAEYFFEPVLLEKMVEEPVFGEGENGERIVIRTEEKCVSEPTKLAFDEFVADMWGKGVRYGIDAATVRGIIQSGERTRAVVARPLEPQLGTDAGIEEQTDGLYRNDAPKKLSNGRFDLRQYKNRFPQVRKGARLLKKTPRVLGVAGQDIGGVPVEPPLPGDFDSADLSGPGTFVDRTRQGEFIVASLDGFLNIDTATNRISVVEKIVNTEGISVRTTGNITLDCNEFEEHGEIQEKCVVKGQNIVVHADVFGSVISTGGNIHLKQNLSGGSATNHNGDITIDNLATGSIVHAENGTVTIQRAENCVIVGKKVIIESAALCDILGESIEIETCEGCSIAGKSMRINSTGPRRDSQAMVSVIVPDLSDFDQQIGETGKQIPEIELAIEKKRQETKVITEQSEVKNYLVLGAKLKKKEIVLSEQQQDNWKALVAKVTPFLAALAKISEAINALQNEKKSLEEEIAALVQRKREASTGISCTIETILGDTLVQTMKLKSDENSLTSLSPKLLKARLNARSVPGSHLFSGHGGPFDWRYKAPDAEQ